MNYLCNPVNLFVPLGHSKKLYYSNKVVRNSEQPNKETTKAVYCSLSCLCPLPFSLAEFELRLLTRLPKPPGWDWAGGPLGAGLDLLGGLDTPLPKPANTLFIAVACFGWVATVIEDEAVVGLPGKSPLSGIVQCQEAATLGVLKIRKNPMRIRFVKVRIGFAGLL